MKIFLTMFFSIFLINICLAQEVSIQKIDATSHLKWANDKVVYEGEPLTRPAAIKIADTFYVAISDTAFTSPSQSIAIYKSIDTGKTWIMDNYGLFGPQIPIHNMKFIKGDGNTFYWFGRIGTDLYYWNVTKSTLGYKPLGGEYDFDIEITANGSWALFADTANNNLRRYVSVDSGKTWPYRGLVTEKGTKLSLASNLSKDTLYLLYRDKGYSTPISEDMYPYHLINYKVNLDGSISVSQNVGLIIPDTNYIKSEIKILNSNKTVWILNTRDSSGNIDIQAMRSTNGGSNFTAVDPPASSSLDEYWFDAVPFGTDGKIDFVCYIDSLQIGPANNQTDYLSYRYRTVFDEWSAPNKFSQNIPFWSPRSYAPVAVELGMYSGYDVGVVFVAKDSLGQTKVFWDKYSASDPPIVSVKDENLPKAFSLTQNYPNPFNPNTVIGYNLPAAQKVKITIYNILGKEVAELVNEFKEAGNHQVNFNADNLSSGTYFYKIQAGNFSDTKKMLLLK